MVDKHSDQIVFTQMKTRQRGEWDGISFKTEDHSYKHKRRLRNIVLSAAAVFCLGIGVMKFSESKENTAQVMTHITADFEYDETLGRLQFVSSILPESAMVFLESGDDSVSMIPPADASIVHAWSQAEPWLEYQSAGDFHACGDGEVMTVVKNREDEYTVRVLHKDGYESVYSGLNDVQVAQYDKVLAGESIGYSDEIVSFELRKDGLSINPQSHEADRN